MPALTIDPRHVGPPRSANGGYACGLLAAAVDGPVAVSLRVPPPVGRELELVVDHHGAHLRDGETRVGETAPWDAPFPEVPATVDVATARAAESGFLGFVEHPFPTCWTCGPDADGLRLFPGPVAGHEEVGLVAAAWEPSPDLDVGDGTVDPAEVWAALDCPSYYGCAAPEPGLLARLAADLRAPVRVGRPHVVLGWRTREADGRKRFGGSAVLDADGRVLAVADALWVTLSPEALEAMVGAA